MNDLEKANGLETMFSRDELETIKHALELQTIELKQEIEDCDNNGFSDVSMDMESELEETDCLLDLFQAAIEIETESDRLKV